MASTFQQVVDLLDEADTYLYERLQKSNSFLTAEQEMMYANLQKQVSKANRYAQLIEEKSRDRSW